MLHQLLIISIELMEKEPCFIPVNLKENIPEKYLNSSARKIKNKKLKFFKNIY